MLCDDFAFAVVGMPCFVRRAICLMSTITHGDFKKQVFKASNSMLHVVSVPGLIREEEQA